MVNGKNNIKRMKLYKINLLKVKLLDFSKIYLNSSLISLLLIFYGFILVIIFFPLTIMMLNFLENKKNLNSIYSFVNIEKSIFI